MIELKIIEMIKNEMNKKIHFLVEITLCHKWKTYLHIVMRYIPLTDDV